MAKIVRAKLLGWDDVDDELPPDIAPAWQYSKEDVVGPLEVVAVGPDPDFPNLKGYTMYLVNGLTVDPETIRDVE